MNLLTTPLYDLLSPEHVQQCQDSGVPNSMVGDITLHQFIEVKGIIGLKTIDALLGHLHHLFAEKYE